ncbi:aminotransferase class I/II-fold pyridoxal phosphate-dependent enzyme [Phormidesmis priestleyi]|uniref:aminotransferase class I/II-fold pyridoxal phosphate-dependent enzyme n=1 Tax=Phormidesmis priestleyi TaxID=268141 RepID=UPI0009EDFD08|nr:aminotransferase class I/II-fold pyridoxal phosphate-dependent enzyme [Phormidesmis priestleyi]
MTPLDISSSQMATPLLDVLENCAQSPNAAFYTPGHKRGQGTPGILSDLFGAEVWRSDLPELPELDNLFAPQTAIKAAQDLAAEAFGADQTWFLVNGSTCGIIASILAVCEPGDKIILPRNVHQSAISGLILSGAVPIFVTPEYDADRQIAHSVTPEAVEEALKQHPDSKAVMMVYPTYYGVCGNVGAIADLAHQHTIPLLVDEAHGAHFAFHPDLPDSALSAGVDLTVQSIHKTLSAMTQAAMLHCQGHRIDRDRVSKALQLVQSTSPSYLLLASLDAARQQMATQGAALMEQTLRLADQARSRINQIPNLSTLNPEQSPGCWAFDRTRLTVTVSELGIDGFTADEILHQTLGVTAELPSLQHLTFITSLGNTQADIDRLVQAFTILAKEPRPAIPQFRRFECLTPQSLLTPRQAFFAPSETLPIAQTVNRISAELVCPYPPGIPVLLPGEQITEDAIANLQQILAAGGMISGCADSTLETLQVIKRA